MAMPTDPFRDCSDEDRAQWREARVDESLPPDLAVVSLGTGDWPGAIAGHIAAGRRVLALATAAQKSLRESALASGISEVLTSGPIVRGEANGRLRLLRIGTALPHNLRLDAAPALLVDGRHHRLTQREHRILCALVAARGGLVRHSDLQSAAWDDTARERRDYLRVAISKLRDRIEPDPHFPRYILTEAALGYRMGSGEPTAPPDYMS